MSARTASGPEQEAGRKQQFLIVVDRNARDLLETGALLQKVGYAVFTTNAAEEALRYLEVAVPSAIITELLLPGMNGMDFIAMLKQDPRSRNVPVIVHTEIKDPKVEELCMVAGSAAFLRKSADINNLYRAIQHAIESTPRSYIRLNTLLKAAVGDAGFTESREYVTALSENGLFMRTLHPRSEGSNHRVGFFLNERKIELRALVLYTFTTAGGPLKEPGMGMKFVEIADGDRQAIREYIKDELMKDLVSGVKHKWQHLPSGDE